MKNNPRTSSVPSQVWLGLAVIGFGVLFLLDNLNVIDRHRVLHYWPVLVVIGGLVKYAEADSGSERLVFGLIAAAGVVLTMNRLGYGYFFSMRTLWPVLLILLGIVVVHRAIHKRRTPGPGPAMKAAVDGDAVINVTAILGAFQRRISTPDFRGGDVSAIMGSCVLDLRESSIEGEAVLNVFAVMGGITIKCPPDWTVVLYGTPLLGGFEEKTTAPPHGAKRLTVSGYAIMGGVEVRN